MMFQEGNSYMSMPYQYQIRSREVCRSTLPGTAHCSDGCGSEWYKMAQQGCALGGHALICLGNKRKSPEEGQLGWARRLARSTAGEGRRGFPKEGRTCRRSSRERGMPRSRGQNDARAVGHGSGRGCQSWGDTDTQGRDRGLSGPCREFLSDPAG